jgi:hypothetical protein
MLPTLRREIKAVDPEVPISEEMTLSDMIANMFMPVQLASTTLSYAGSGFFSAGSVCTVFWRSRSANGRERSAFEWLLVARRATFSGWSFTRA